MMKKIREERSVNMETMVVNKNDSYKSVAAKLYKENQKLKQEIEKRDEYIGRQSAKIQKLERSLLSAVTHLRWER